MNLNCRSLAGKVILAAVSFAAGALATQLRGVAPAVAANAPPPVTFISGARVAEGFRKGGVLVKGPDMKYQIHTSRRVAPGTPELHELDTDLFYIQQGTATFVTGGTIMDPKTTGPHEVSGRSIQGGVDHHLAKGDVIIIPKGTPHWYREVKAPFTYYTIKVR
jgi:mannose-6-phosphate isomerase-like protein (cupin superfamily)